jgi:branched-chain amino acid transport system substrate-binding protein
MVKMWRLLWPLVLLSGMAAETASAEKQYGPGVTDSEIKIGQTMPYSGPLSSTSVISRTELAYFRMLNEQGGINGRRITLISLDDGFLPQKTVEQTRWLVEQEQVLALIGSFGSATNAAVQKYLTHRRVPQLFILAAASRWNDPAHFPWTMPLVLPVRSEAKAHADYVVRTNPKARVAVLYQDDDFGKDYLAGLTAEFGAAQIAASASYQPTDPTLDSQIIVLKASGADTLVLATTPKFTAQAVRKIFDIGWHPTRFIAQLSASVAGVLEPAGPERSKGVMAVATLKSASDPQWQDDPEYRTWVTFMRKYYPQGDLADQLTISGYSYAVLIAEVLRRCGDNLTRENLMQVATHLEGVRIPMLLPGITLNTSPNDYNPIKQWRLQRFDGHKWELLDDLIEK